jgi:c-di-GMP-binding flagellar brake protein YcgR
MMMLFFFVIMAEEGNGGLIHMVPGISTVLYIVILSSNGDEHKLYKSRVANVTKEGLTIEIPIEDGSGKMIPLPVNTRLQLWYFGQDGSKYIFTSIVLDKVKDDIPALLLSTPKADQIERIQRRNYLRVPATLETAMQSESNPKLHFLVQTLDISGGGVSLNCSKEYQVEAGNTFQCWMAIPFRKGMEYVSFIAKIIRGSTVKEEEVYRSYSMLFKEIKEADRDKIVRYCFERQVELHKKGVL